MRSKAFERYHDLVECDPIGADPRDFIRNALSYSSPASTARAGSASVRDGGVFVRENNDNAKSNSNFRSNWKERKTFSRDVCSMEIWRDGDVAASMAPRRPRLLRIRARN